jgi:hypothetical protein
VDTEIYISVLYRWCRVEVVVMLSSALQRSGTVLKVRADVLIERFRSGRSNQLDSLLVGNSGVPVATGPVLASLVTKVCYARWKQGYHAICR